MTGSGGHVPVLLEETIAALTGGAVDTRAGVFVDVTFGRGGHAQALLAALGPGARLIGLDRDPAAAPAATLRDPRFSFVPAPFSRFAEVLDAAGIAEVDGVIADLGVSSPQLDDPDRGFSFSQDGPLDMRMDTTAGETAAEWLARVDEAELADTIYIYGEERHSRRIARAIVAARADRAITRTAELAAIVSAAVPGRERNKHPATRTFQALRIAVNAELKELAALLDAVPRRLKPGGRFAVIAFHSLEDREVKLGFRDLKRSGVDDGSRRFAIPVRLEMAGPEERSANPRARSARLRVLERLS